jgi:ABC-2 type transport system permease protein
VYLALARAGFRRYASYRIATVAGASTNVVFGFIRYYTLLAVATAAGGSVAGYSGAKIATYVWGSQGILAVVSLWGDIGEPQTYPLFLASTALAVVVCFGCRFIVQCSAYWLLDVRGPVVLWLLASGLGSGLYFPLWLVPEPWSTIAVYALPFASIIQAPMDILVERADHPYLMIATQAFWAVVVLLVGRAVQRRAERKLVVQGG